MPRIVGPEGSTNSKIVIVGEAPGRDEEITGRPFVGSAGNLLEQCMHSVGIARSECYLTNVIKEHPKDNIIDPFFSKKGFSIDGWAYVQQLKEELSTVSSNIIVACGNTALAALCGKDSVSKWRGSVLESTLIPGKKVIPILHPASALREYLFKWYIIADLRRIRRESMFPEIKRVERNIILRPSFTQALTYLEHALSIERVGFDIEVVNQEVACFCVATSNTEAMVVPLLHRPNTYAQNYWTEDEEIAIIRALDRLLNSKSMIVGQNVMFDISFLTKKYGIITRAKLFDTMIGHHVTYYDFPKGLDFLCSIYEDEPYYKDEGKIWKNPKIKDDEFWTYCGKDGCVTLGSSYKIEKEMNLRGTCSTYDFTMELFDVLLYMQMRGIKADRKRLEEARQNVQEKIRVAQEELDVKSGGLNVNSPKQCQDYFYIKLGNKPYISRKTGSITTDDKAMTKLERKGCREATLVKEIRGLKKLSGTYLDIEFDNDSRLRCSYNPAGTTTGRLSSSQTIFGTGANFQNIPPEFKTFLVADDGFFLAEFDKRQAEWIETAFLSSDANMMEVIDKQLDAHVRTAELMFPGMPKELILKDADIIGNSTDETWILEQRKKYIPDILKFNPTISMSCRQAAKKSNHGYNYDLGAQGFADANQMPLDDAKLCYIKYHRAYPGVKQWHKRTVEELQSKNRTLETFFGRKRWFGDRWADDLFKAAYAYRPQSTVADSVNLALIAILKDQTDYMQPIDILGQVHDSILIQYPLDRIENFGKAAVMIKKYMEPTITYYGRSHVIPTDMKIGMDWGKAKINKETKEWTGGMREIKLTDSAEEVSKALLDVLEYYKGV